MGLTIGGAARAASDGRTFEWPNPATGAVATPIGAPGSEAQRPDR